MKIDRQKVYEKYNGHCAYCGKAITIEQMQVDHALARRNGGTDDISNLMPSCRLCNHYKRAADIKTFRNFLLGGLIDRLMKIYIFRVALNYGMITINDWDKTFYFEKKDKTMYCGECDCFLYEDTYGFGICDNTQEECRCSDRCHMTQCKP